MIIMDGLSDDSPFISVVFVADWIDRGGFWLLVLPFALFWYHVTHRRSDLVIIVICLAWNLRCSIIPLCYELARSRLALGSVALTATVSIGLQLFGYIWKWRHIDEPQSGTPSAYLIPCRVTHSREHPKKHAFSYSYLTVGISVGYRGNVNGMISVDDPDVSTSWLSKIWRARSWFRVDAADYLERGNNKLGLRAKLDKYLISQDANPADYPHAFLVTVPKFLGYQFNPVSFWYLYSSDRTLSAVVVEMNNTFGERRPYLVLRDTTDDATRITSNEVSQLTPVWLNGTWKKDFHMSPFNSRNGSYSLLARDPFEGNMEGFRGIDIALNLVSSKGQPKLDVRLYSEGKALEASQMGPLEQAKFVLTWFWVGFLTFPRIIREGAPLSVTYIPSGLIESSEETITSPGATVQPEQTECLKIKILTPVFYSRFVHYAHDFEAIFCELAESFTIWVDQPETLPKIFLKKQPPPLHVPSFMDYLYFKTIQRLRRRPARITRPMTSAGSVRPTTTPEDVRGFQISPMDAFVLQYSSQEIRASYRSLLARMFVADWVFFGIPAIIDALLLSGVFGVAWWLLSFGSVTPC
ncbi:hypothetical protein N5P37_007335 [Trichoderma harzianum]|nr:hypothetical protein N5P37_007335 [Trichoderma harzianum]